MVEAPLEQFQILLLIPLKLSSLDFSITNFLLINLLCLLSIVFIIYCNNSSFEFDNSKDDSFYLISNSWQKSLAIITEISAQLVNDIITNNKEKYFPFISMLLNYILLHNLIGLIPYSFTTTSHLIITFTI